MQSRTSSPLFRFLWIIAVVPLLSYGTAKADDKTAPLKLTQRYRLPLDEGGYEVRAKETFWQPAETAIIVCDMWDAHHCLNAVRRVEELVPVMNQVLEKARARGVLIVNAPSGCMAAYKDHPARVR